MKNFLLSFLIISILFACNAAPKSDNASNNNTVVKDSAIISGDQIPKELIDLNEKVKKRTGDPSVYAARAVYFVRHQNLDAAYEDLIKGFAIDSTFMPLYNSLADYHLMKGEPAQAKQALEKALSINKSSYMTYVKMGELFFLAKKYDLAFKQINNGLRINKYYSDGYFWKGMIYKEKADTLAANANFQTAIEQDPENYKAYMQLGLLAIPSRNKMAIDYFTSAIKVDATKTEAFYGRAYYYQLVSEFDKAIQDYTKVVEIDKHNAAAFYNLGILHYNLRVIEIAAANFNKAIENNPKYAEAFYMRGLCNEAKSNDDAAIADFEYALSLKENYTLAAQGLDRVRSAKQSIKK